MTTATLPGTPDAAQIRSRLEAFGLCPQRVVKHRSGNYTITFWDAAGRLPEPQVLTNGVLSAVSGARLIRVNESLADYREDAATWRIGVTVEFRFHEGGEGLPISPEPNGDIGTWMEA